MVGSTPVLAEKDRLMPACRPNRGGKHNNKTFLLRQSPVVSIRGIPAESPRTLLPNCASPSAQDDSLGPRDVSYLLAGIRNARSSCRLGS